MPKLTDSAELAGEDEIHAVAARKVAASLDDDDGQLIILIRIDNNRVEYAFQNREDPTLTGVTDAVLMSAIIDAGKRYGFERRKKLSVTDRPSGIRNNGAKIVYKDQIVIDFQVESISSTRKQATTLQALAIIVQNLAESAARNAPSPPAAN